MNRSNEVGAVQWVFYQGSNHELWEDIELGTGWGAFELGREMAEGASPGATLVHSSGMLSVYYKGSNNELWRTFEPGTGWGAGELGSLWAESAYSPLGLRGRGTLAEGSRIMLC